MYVCFIYAHVYLYTYCVYRKAAIDYENVDLILAPEDQTTKEESAMIDEHFSLFKTVILLLMCYGAACYIHVCHCVQ